MTEDVLNVSEIFASIQGEGPAIGKPCIFVRMAGCNLNCEGCDTPIRNSGKEISIELLVKRIENFLDRYPRSRLVFTGGEPLLQLNGILEIVNSFPTVYHDVETNGTILDRDRLKYFDLVVNSPKKTQFKTLKDAVNFFREWDMDNVYFKLVMGHLKWNWSEAEIKTILEEVGLYEKFWIMPAGDNISKLNISGKSVWKAAIKLGINYSDRLHIRCGGR